MPYYTGQLKPKNQASSSRPSDSELLVAGISRIIYKSDAVRPLETGALVPERGIAAMPEGFEAG